MKAYQRYSTYDGTVQVYQTHKIIVNADVTLFRKRNEKQLETTGKSNEGSN